MSTNNICFHEEIREILSGYSFYQELLVVCVEVLPPSQLNGIMSSMVSLPNHMFTGRT